MHMKKPIQFAGALFITSLAIVTLAEQPRADFPLRLALDLVDGSHIIGIPSVKSIPVQTSYAKMDIPLRQIACMQIAADHETASFELQNGDTFKGVFSFDPLRFQTIFGDVTIPVAHIRSVAIRLDGPAPWKGEDLHGEMAPPGSVEDEFLLDYENHSFNGIRFGMKMNEVIDMYGKQAFPRFRGRIIEERPRKAFRGRYDFRFRTANTFFYTEGDQVENIHTWSPNLVTDAGLRHGDTIAKMIDIYGKPISRNDRTPLNNEVAYDYRLGDFYTVFFFSEKGTLCHVEVLDTGQ